MREEAAARFVDGLKAADIRFLAMLSESWLFEARRLAEADPLFTVVPVANEAEAVGLCARAWTDASAR